MELSKKFQQGENRHTYQRIDEDYQVNFFVGYNDSGKMSMILTESGRDVRVKSSNLIDVNLNRREDGKLALSFDLMDQSYASMFLVFCKDMIVVCEREGRNRAIESAIVRWNYWLKMFGKKRDKYLEKSVVKGLIGELMIMKEYLIPLYGYEQAITGWMGPQSGHKDYEIGETWYEIKTTTAGATEVTINSAEQLDSTLEGHLGVVRLDDASPISNTSLNLNEVIIDVMDCIELPEIMDLFRAKLDLLGYESDEYYNDFAFVYSGFDLYSIKDSFPRITRNELYTAIGNVQYSLLLGAIENFKEERNEH